MARIELKNLKVAECLSEETTAFTATVYVDGKRAFAARNQGHGGENMLDRLPSDKDGSVFKAAIATLEEHCRTAPPVVCGFDDPNTGKPATLTLTVDFAISLAVEEALHLKDMKKCLKKITVVDPAKQGIQCFKASFKPTRENLAYIADKYPTFTILNSLSEEEALKIWKADGVLS